MSALEGSVAMAQKRPNNPYIPTQVFLVNKDTKAMEELVYNGVSPTAEELDWANKNPLQKLGYHIKEYFYNLMWPKAPTKDAATTKVSYWAVTKTCSAHYAMAVFGTIATEIMDLMPNGSLCYLVAGDSVTVDVKDPPITFSNA